MVRGGNIDKQGIAKFFNFKLTCKNSPTKQTLIKMIVHPTTIDDDDDKTTLIRNCSSCSRSIPTIDPNNSEETWSSTKKQW